jgi:hypothetical protein
VTILLNAIQVTRPVLRILRVFMDDPAIARYGLELAKLTGLQSGTLYPVLARMENHGLVTADWEDIDESAEGPPPPPVLPAHRCGNQRGTSGTGRTGTVTIL